jgi:cytochrome P450
MSSVASPSVAARDSADWLNLLTDAVREHGDVVRFHRGWLFAHPDAVRDVLVTHDRKFTKSPALRWARFTLGNGLLTNEGATYRRQRALVQPSLHPKALGGYAGVMARHAADVSEGWRDGVAIDVHREMTRLTLRIVAEALFGTPIGPEVDAVSRAMDLNVGMFRRLISPWGWLKVLLPTPFTFRFLVGRRRLVATLRRFIADRRSSGERRDDLLSRLLGARDAEDGAGMTERQLVDECVTLFAAGHETTASALTFTLWLLARNPEVMRRLQREVDAVLAGGRVPGMADVEALPYARAVVAEGMRLYPPAWIHGRLA